MGTVCSMSRTKNDLFHSNNHPKGSLKLAQTSVKRRNILIVSIIIVVLVISSIEALIIFYHQSSPTKLYVNTSLNQTNVIQGNNLQALVNVTSIGKAENVTLSSNSGSSGINGTFEPPSGKYNFTSTLTMSVPDCTPTGNYTLTVTALGNRQEQNASLVVFVYPQSAGITVSGEVDSFSLSQPWQSRLIDIQFTDVQTGSETSFDFSNKSAVGDYSVVLIKEHTYNVSITYYTGPTEVNVFSEISTEYIGNLTVVAPAGEKAISDDFG